MKIEMKPLADMHSDGVYFEEYLREEMKKKREEEICQYSGLPSVQAYEKEKNSNNGIVRIS
jgi:hypothetical protein